MADVIRIVSLETVLIRPLSAFLPVVIVQKGMDLVEPLRTEFLLTRTAIWPWARLSL
jgi:hypothetical protein